MSYQAIPEPTGEIEQNFIVQCQDESRGFAWRDEDGNFYSEKDGRLLQVTHAAQWGSAIH